MPSYEAGSPTLWQGQDVRDRERSPSGRSFLDDSAQAAASSDERDPTFDERDPTFAEPIHRPTNATPSPTNAPPGPTNGPTHPTNGTPRSTNTSPRPTNGPRHPTNATLRSTNATLRSTNGPPRPTNATLRPTNGPPHPTNGPPDPTNATLRSTNGPPHPTNGHPVRRTRRSVRRTAHPIRRMAHPIRRALSPSGKCDCRGRRVRAFWPDQASRSRAISTCKARPPSSTPFAFSIAASTVGLFHVGEGVAVADPNPLHVGWLEADGLHEHLEEIVRPDAVATADRNEQLRHVGRDGLTRRARFGRARFGRARFGRARFGARLGRLRLGLDPGRLEGGLGAARREERLVVALFRGGMPVRELDGRRGARLAGLEGVARAIVTAVTRLVRSPFALARASRATFTFAAMRRGCLLTILGLRRRLGPLGERLGHGSNDSWRACIAGLRVRDGAWAALSSRSVVAVLRLGLAAKLGAP